MPFFFPQQQPSLAREQQEKDIFQLLSLLDSSSPQCGPRRQHRPVQTFTPRFDIVETGSAYELFGEVPGLDQQSLDIQFEDAQTIVLKGRTQRPAATSNIVAVEEKAVEEPAAQEPEKENHHATVEDEYDSVDTPLTTATTATATASPSSAPANDEKKAATTTEAPKARYWLSERRFGDFARSFSFSQRLEIDDVTAELREGILHVVVPKSVKSRKVAVSLNN